MAVHSHLFISALGFVSRFKLIVMVLIYLTINKCNHTARVLLFDTGLSYILEPFILLKVLLFHFFIILFLVIKTEIWYFILLSLIYSAYIPTIFNCHRKSNHFYHQIIAHIVAVIR